MAIQGHAMYRQGPIGGPSQQGRLNYSSTHPNYYNNHVVYHNPSQHVTIRFSAVVETHDCQSNKIYNSKLMMIKNQ